MLFKNLLLGSIFIAATAFAQPADSTTKSSGQQFSTISTVSSSPNYTIASLNKQKKIIKPTTTWTKIKDLFN